MFLGYSLYCVIGGVIFVLPVFGFELILEHGAFMVFEQPQIADIGVLATVNGSPIFAYLFFSRRHMAALKKLGYFIPFHLQISGAHTRSLADQGRGK
jgi:hypothetical protein